MAGELLWRSLAYAAALIATVCVFRRRGQRAAGVLAALPVLSAPALFTLSAAHDPVLAVATAVSALHATGLTASLVLFFGLSRRRLGTAAALLCSGLCVLLEARLSCRIGHDFVPALILTSLCVAAARQLLPQLASGGCVCRFLRGYLDGLLVRTTFLTVLAATLGPLGGWLAFALAMLAAAFTLLGVTRLPQGLALFDGGSATTRAERS